MIYKQNLQAFEPETLLIDGILLRKRLLMEKVAALRRGVFIPDSLIAEIEQFTSRNGLGQVIADKHLTQPVKEACPHCLKAHTLKHASEMGLPKESLVFLNAFISGNNGHHGYYMDKDNLVKIKEEN